MNESRHSCAEWDRVQNNSTLQVDAIADFRVNTAACFRYLRYNSLQLWVTGDARFVWRALAHGKMQKVGTRVAGHLDCDSPDLDAFASDTHAFGFELVPVD